MRARARPAGDLVRHGFFVVLFTAFGSAGLACLHCAVAHGHDALLYECLLRISGATLAVTIVALLGLYLSARDFTDDLTHLTHGIERLVGGDASGEQIAVRTYDALGILTKRFGELREHFVEALGRERAARRALEDADSYKSEFLTAVSHELRTPLNAVLGFADVLLDGIDGPINDAQREDVLLIRSAGEHLVELFNDVLDLAAAASGGLRLERRWVSLPPLIEGVVAELQGLRVGRNVKLTSEIPADLPDVYADPLRVRQILVNLIENAMKFTERGKVCVRAMPV
ncbi:MAG: hypothetical protein H5U40_11400, partial [Polyangiaceae bacterium]|nr:hypothetical protein [Polyangiaceae bacterium]